MRLGTSNGHAFIAIETPTMALKTNGLIIRLRASPESIWV